MNHRKLGAIRTHFEERSRTIGSTTGRDPQQQGPIGGVVQCQRQDQKISNGSLTIRRDHPPQFTERARLGRNRKNDTRIIRRIGNESTHSRTVCNNRNMCSIGRGTEIHATHFASQGTRRLRCRVQIKRVQGRQGPIGHPSVNHTCPVSPTLLRGKENPPLTLRHRHSLRPHGVRQQKQPRPRYESDRAQESTPGTNRLKKLNDGAHFTVKNLAFFCTLKLAALLQVFG